MEQYPKKVSQLSNEPYFAILVPSSTYVPGDQRSMDHPGHGYPASTEHHWDILAFESQEEWESEVLRLQNRGDDFQAVKIVPAKITTNISIDIGNREFVSR
jgi:hypothetical protein